MFHLVCIHHGALFRLCTVSNLDMTGLIWGRLSELWCLINLIIFERLVICVILSDGRKERPQLLGNHHVDRHSAVLLWARVTFISTSETSRVQRSILVTPHTVNELRPLSGRLVVMSF